MFDLFCKAGGAGMGYHMAGYDVVGFDIEPQPRYPFRFYQWDVLTLEPEWIAEKADAVHASPPCKLHTSLSALHKGNPKGHLNLIPPTRELLDATGLPYIIENVPGSPLLAPVVCCGSSFGLRVRRHRHFESNIELRTPACNHEWQERHMVYERRTSKGRGYTEPSGTVPVYGKGSQMLFDTAPDTLRERIVTAAAMGIDWMNIGELSQAIPPVYTMHLGRQLLRAS